MNIEHLVTMANQIGDFFESYPDQIQAKKDIVSHLKNFWALNMRRQIVQHVTEKEGVGLEPIVATAIKEYATLLT